MKDNDLHKLLIILAKKLTETEYELATYVILASRNSVQFGYQYNDQFLDEAKNFYHKFKNSKSPIKINKNKQNGNILNFVDFKRN
jgi:hypothetical protein|tara:strand:- start:28 stop:282 length:255 start_codon:yes stop_codon:yes gene_type:complete